MSVQTFDEKGTYHSGDVVYYTGGVRGGGGRTGYWSAVEGVKPPWHRSTVTDDGIPGLYTGRDTKWLSVPAPSAGTKPKAEMMFSPEEAGVMGYEILGVVGATPILGADFSVSDAMKALTEVTSRVETEVQKKQASEKAKGEAEIATRASAADLKKAIDADAAATVAVAAAEIATVNKIPSADAERAMAETRLSAQDDAARDLSPENKKKRAEAAKKALEERAAAWQTASDSTRAGAQSLYRAAQKTYAKTQNALLVEQATTPPAATSGRGGSWLTRPVLGPLPGAAVLGIGAVALGGLAVLVVKLVRR